MLVSSRPAGPLGHVPLKARLLHGGFRRACSVRPRGGPRCPSRPAGGANGARVFSGIWNLGKQSPIFFLVKTMEPQERSFAGVLTPGPVRLAGQPE